MDPISIIFSVPEKNLRLVSEEMQKTPHLKVEAWESSNTSRLAEGYTNALDNQLDTSTGTIRIRAILKNTQHKLFPNQFVNVHLFVKTLENVVLAPVNSLQIGPDGPFVYRIDPKNNTAMIQRIQTGYGNANEQVITFGLVGGEELITEGIDNLREGDPVTVINKNSENMLNSQQ